MKYTEVRFNTKPDDTAFARPEGFEELPTPTPPPTRETKLAEGVYLPKERLIFQGDLVNLPFSGKYMPSTVNDTTLHFFVAVTRLKLDVRRVAAVHGPSTTWDDLREAVEKKRAGR